MRTKTCMVLCAGVLLLASAQEHTCLDIELGCLRLVTAAIPSTQHRMNTTTAVAGIRG